MKHTPVIPEQHWLNEPTKAELERRAAKLAAWLLAIGIVALTGWSFFLWAVLTSR
jgi:hypothetical protein